MIKAMTVLSKEYQAIHPKVEQIMVGGMNHCKTALKHNMTENLFNVIASKTVKAVNVVDGKKVYTDINVIDIKRLDVPKPKDKVKK